MSSSLVKFGRRQSARLQSLSSRQVVALALTAMVSAGVAVSAAAGQIALAIALLALLLVNLDRDAEALAAAEAGLAVDERLGGTPTRTRGLVYRGRARAHLGDPAGIDEVRSALQVAFDAADPEAAFAFDALPGSTAGVFVG